LTIATRNVTMAVTETEGETGAPIPGDYVMVQVADTGEGMPPEVVARVFEPFFTTKQPGRGSGLGLSQVHGLAAQSGGEVRVESMLGEGTTVTLLLPRAHAAQRPRLAPQEVAALARPAIRVLVVDDDRDVRTMTAEMLSELGYAPTTAADGAEALALLDADAGFSALLADYAMPGMNGLSLIRAAEARRPSLRSLLVTGHAEVQVSDVQAAETLNAARVIRKPFTLATLSERLSVLVEAPALPREVARVG
jgi:CheY-like chemotaxis protein